MIWAILAILGVPIWLVLGLLGGSLASRRRFLRRPDVFRVMVSDDGWPRRAAHGRIVHDVLVVQRGLALVRTEILGMRTVLSAADTADGPPFDGARIFSVTFDDAAPVSVAAAEPGASRLDGLAGVAVAASSSERPGPGDSRHDDPRSRLPRTPQSTDPLEQP